MKLSALTCNFGKKVADINLHLHKYFFKTKHVEINILRRVVPRLF
jgi:hypothetical protein